MKMSSEISPLMMLILLVPTLCVTGCFVGLVLTPQGSHDAGLALGGATFGIFAAIAIAARMDRKRKDRAGK